MIKIQYCNNCGKTYRVKFPLIKCPNCGSKLSFNKKALKDTIFSNTKNVSNENIRPKESIIKY